MAGAQLIARATDVLYLLPVKEETASSDVSRQNRRHRPHRDNVPFINVGLTLYSRIVAEWRRIADRILPHQYKLSSLAAMLDIIAPPHIIS